MYVLPPSSLLSLLDEGSNNGTHLIKNIILHSEDIIDISLKLYNAFGL